LISRDRQGPKSKSSYTLHMEVLKTVYQGGRRFPAQTRKDFLLCKHYKPHLCTMMTTDDDPNYGDIKPPSVQQGRLQRRALICQLLWWASAEQFRFIACSLRQPFSSGLVTIGLPSSLVCGTTIRYTYGPTRTYSTTRVLAINNDSASNPRMCRSVTCAAPPGDQSFRRGTQARPRSITSASLVGDAISKRCYPHHQQGARGVPLWFPSMDRR